MKSAIYTYIYIYMYIYLTMKEICSFLQMKSLKSGVDFTLTVHLN